MAVSRRTLLIGAVGAALIVGLVAAWLLLRPALPITTAPHAHALSAFGSEADLARYINRLRAQERLVHRSANLNTFDVAAPAAAPAAAEQASITNNQVAGVDEGDIVKARGDLMVVLRRGRLFTIDTAAGSARAVSHIQAYPPGVDGSGDWYDEMLLDGGRVIVVGYSYSRGGTQVNRFRLSAQGQLAFEDSTAFRSGDYYSSRNYASRLIGHRLILYAPLWLGDDQHSLAETMPAMRRWEPGTRGGTWRPTTSARSVFIPPALLDARKANAGMLHSVTSCDVTAAVLDCSSTGVLGSASRSFYVAADAIYLWVGDVWRDNAFAVREHHAGAFLYRLPLDGSAPSAVQVRGQPIDQFSFAADAARGVLHVLVQGEGGGDAMWAPEVAGGKLALLDVPLRAFGDGGGEVPISRYRNLPPTPSGDAQNRFVGDWLIYGANRYGEQQESSAWAASVVDGAVTPLPVSTTVDRIDAVGSNAIIIGSRGRSALGFTVVALPGRAAASLLPTLLVPNAAQADWRSHGFFFLPDPAGGGGMMGLPVTGAGNGNSYDDGGRNREAAIQFLRLDAAGLRLAGSLASGQARAEDDQCVASCYDWYGDARPIFLDGRVWALLGFQLVGGSSAGGIVVEDARVSFAPGARPRSQP